MNLCSCVVYFQSYRYRLAILVVNAEGPHCLCSAKWKTSGKILLNSPELEAIVIDVCSSVRGFKLVYMWLEEQ